MRAAPVRVSMALSGLAVAVVVADLLVLALAGAGVYLLFERRGRKPSPEEWRGRTATLAARLHEELAGREPPHDADEVARAILPLVGQFERLARDVPSTVDDSLARRVNGLAIACRRLGIEYPHRRPGVASGSDSYADLLDEWPHAPSASPATRR